jgi:hypothetical protein
MSRRGDVALPLNRADFLGKRAEHQIETDNNTQLIGRTWLYGMDEPYEKLQQYAWFDVDNDMSGIFSG